MGSDKVTQAQVLSKETLMSIWEMRWFMNGIQKLKEVYRQYRLDAVKNEDFDEFRQIYIEFQQSISERLTHNFEELLGRLGISHE